MICYLSPPITITFLLGVFWKKASTFGSFFTLVSGSIMGIAGFIMSTYFGITIFIFENFWMAGVYLAIICLFIHIVASLYRPDPGLTEEQRKLVWERPLDALKGEAWRGPGNYRFLAATLIVVLIAIYCIFG